MNIKQLETFVQIVRKGSFSAAAEALHTTQSTVSARVKDLERDLGVALFDRSAHRAQLTLKGRQLFEMSPQVMRVLDQLRERIGDPQSLTGTLRLGAVGLVAGTWLVELVQALRSRHPALDLQVDVALSKTLEQRLRAAELDVAIIAGRAADEALCSEPLSVEHFAWMASPMLDLARGEVRAADLAARPVIAFTRESHHHAVMQAWFKAAGVRFQPAIACNSMDVIARLAAQGLGVALLPRDFYRDELAAGRLEVLQARPAIEGVEFNLLSAAARPSALVSAVRDAVTLVRKPAAPAA